MTAFRQSKKPAPDLNVSQWFNTSDDLSLETLRGRPILLHAFQMLCPACVSHGVPQMRKAHELFSQTDLAVIGLHTVFEHHAAMTSVALAAFIHEYGLVFPVGVDRPGASGGLPETMARYEMRGTPTTIVLDRAGRMVMHSFGIVDDMALGSVIHSVLAGDVAVEPAPGDQHARRATAGPDTNCDDMGCMSTGSELAQQAERS